MDPAASLRAGSRGRPSPHELAWDRENSCFDSVGAVGSMVLERPQRADDVFDFILLEQADGGDAGRSSVQARRGVSQVNAAESENGDLRPAGFAQGGEAGGRSSGSNPFSEYWSKNGEVSTLGLHANHVLVRVAGDGNQELADNQWRGGRNSQKQ